MIDIVYLIVTVAFFATMLAYVAACDHLGRAADGREDGQP